VYDKLLKPRLPFLITLYYNGLCKDIRLLDGAVPGLDTSDSENVYKWQNFVKTLAFYSLPVT